MCTGLRLQQYTYIYIKKYINWYKFSPRFCLITEEDKKNLLFLTTKKDLLSFRTTRYQFSSFGA